MSVLDAAAAEVAPSTLSARSHSMRSVHSPSAAAWHEEEDAPADLRARPSPPAASPADAIDIEMEEEDNNSVDDATSSAVPSLAAAEDEDIDDDELTILAVRRVLHLPAHPHHHAHHRRIVHSPVDLVDEDDEDETKPAEAAPAAAASASSSSDDDEEDVCAVCLSAPTDYTRPSACAHAFCYLCLEQWTKIQLGAIYQAQEEARWQAAMPGYAPPVNTTKKKAPSCPLCKREYTALQRRISKRPPARASPPAAASSSPLPPADGTYETIPIERVLPPPSQYHRPHELQIDRSTPSSSNEFFRLAFEAGSAFAMRCAPSLRSPVLAELLTRHPRLNQLLVSYPPYRDRLQDVRDEVVRQILQARNQYLQREQRRLGAYQRQQALRMDHGAGIEQVPMMNDRNAAQQILMNRLSPHGSQALLAMAFGSPNQQPQQQQLRLPYTNPIITLYREARYQGGMTHQLGRMRLWSDLKLAHVPPQPDIIWALGVCEVGRGAMIPFPDTINPGLRGSETTAASASNTTSFATASTVAAAAAAAASASPPAAAASSSSSSATTPTPRDALTRWLNIELTSILSARHEASAIFSPEGERAPPTQHFMVTLVLSYLELLLNKLVLEENDVKLKRAARLANASATRRRQGVKRNRSATNRMLQEPFESTTDVSASPLPSPLVSPSAAVASASPSPAPSASTLPPLASSFVPSYFSTHSSLHPLPEGAPTQLPPIPPAAAAAAGAPSSRHAASLPAAAAASVSIPLGDSDTDEPSATVAASGNSERSDSIHIDDDEDVVVINRPATTPAPRNDEDVIIIGDEDGPAAPATSASSRPSSRNSSARPRSRLSPGQLPGGHLHSLFALSAPLSSAVDFLHAKLEEFLRGFTGVFVHRLLLFILSQAYSSPDAGPTHEETQRVHSTTGTSSTAAASANASAAPAEAEEQRMSALLEDARKRWREARNLELNGPHLTVASPVAAAAAASASPPPSATATVEIDADDDADVRDAPPMVRTFSSSRTASSAATSHHHPLASRITAAPLRTPPSTDSDEDDAQDKRNGEASAASFAAAVEPFGPSLLDDNDNDIPTAASSRRAHGNGAAHSHAERRRKKVRRSDERHDEERERDSRILSGMFSSKRPRPPNATEVDGI